MNNEIGYIYILTNPSFPQYVKIGYANDLNSRLNQLNRSECIPFAFRVYAYYKVPKRLTDTEIHKIIDCMNKNLGCSVYECPECGDFIFVGNTCKSRLCTSCGYKYKLERVENIMMTAYNCVHRQIVFTIPKEYRKYFFYPFDRIDILYLAVNMTINSILNEKYSKNKKGKKRKYKSKLKYTPGFFAFLHTFGRDLKWNPHIHILIAEMKISKIDIKKWDYFDYNALSMRFQKILTDLMIKNFDDFNVDDARKNYFNHNKGFYV